MQNKRLKLVLNKLELISALSRVYFETKWNINIAIYFLRSLAFVSSFHESFELNNEKISSYNNFRLFTMGL